MDFVRPWVLYLLLLLPVLVMVQVLASKRRREELAHFTGEALAEVLAPGRSWRKSLLKNFMFISAVSLMIFALAGPRFGRQLVKVEREGIDLVIALDTSLSMLAEDMKPNRLERAKMEVVDLIKGLKGDRVALVAFAGDAFPLCPLTVDYDAALMMASAVDVNTVSEPGTAIGKAIQKSLSLFENSSRKDRALILITDGESHEGDPVGEAKIAAKQGVRIYTIGIGNPAGELIPLRGTNGVVEEYKKDKNGETVMTKLDERTLDEIARVSGGKYTPATKEGLELKVIYKEIAGMEKKKIKGEFVERKRDRFFWFMASAFLLLVMELFIPSRGSAAGKRILHTGAVFLFIVLLSVFPENAACRAVKRSKALAGNRYFEAGQYDKALVLYREALGDSTKPPKHYQGVYYNEANTYYKMGKYKEALKLYQESFDPKDSTLTGSMLYNRGNMLLETGELEDAVASYTQAIKFIPDDPDILFNLELALKKLKQKRGEKKQQGKKERPDKKKEQKKKSDQNKSRQQRNESDKKRAKQQQSSRSDSTVAPVPSQRDTTSNQKKERQSKPMKVLSKEDALRILKALEEQEKNLQKEKKRAAFKKIRKKGKDW